MILTQLLIESISGIKQKPKYVTSDESFWSSLQAQWSHVAMLERIAVFCGLTLVGSSAPHSCLLTSPSPRGMGEEEK